MYYLCWLVWRQDETGDGDTVGWWLLVAVDGPDGFVTPAHGKIIHTTYIPLGQNVGGGLHRRFYYVCVCVCCTCRHFDIFSQSPNSQHPSSPLQLMMALFSFSFLTVYFSSAANTFKKAIGSSENTDLSYRFNCIGKYEEEEEL